MSALNLPNEILMGIFEEVARLPWAPAHEEQLRALPLYPISFPWTDDASIMAISHVCRRWRESSLATAACWSTIVVDLDGDSHQFDLRTSKIVSHINRTRNQPLTVIIRNEKKKICDMPGSFLDMVHECIQRTTHLFVRFTIYKIGLFISHELRTVPNVKHLVFWRIQASECGVVWPLVQTPSTQTSVYLPWLRTAPLLETVHTRGIPCSDIGDGPLALPSATTLIVDEGLDSSRLHDYNHLFNTFSNVTLLVLLFDAPREIRESVVFHRLLVLQMNLVSAYSLFGPSSKMSTPELRDLSLHAQDGVTHGNLVGIAACFLASTSSVKHATFIGFATSNTRSLHLALLRAVSIFNFVDHLVFRHCVFRFPSGWNDVWSYGGEVDWDTAIVEDYDLTHRLEFETGDESNGENSDQEESLVSSSSPQGFSVDANEPQDDDVVIFLDDPCFMPNLSSLSFNSCRFTDMVGAAGFAKALVTRQAHLKRGNGTRVLEKISFGGLEDPFVSAFANRLRNSVVMKGVAIDVS